MSRLALKAIQAAAGGVGEAVYVDDVFSTYVYAGNSSTNQIDNGIDLAGEGGLIWLKKRSGGTTGADHSLIDTERGRLVRLKSNTTNAELSFSQLDSFNSDGFTLSGSGEKANLSGKDYASWTFRKQPGFFDVVTYTGDGNSGRTVNHNLGSVPGFMVVKKTNSTSDFTTYHRSMGATKYAPLNDTDKYNAGSAIWNNTEPTATQFTVGDNTRMNNSGDSYVAYLFAHDEQDFGTGSDEAIIKCGSYTGNGSTTSNDIDIGFEPQWVLIKNTTSNNQWYIFDVMRGIASEPGGDAYLLANTNGAEVSSENYIDILPNGFSLRDDNAAVNASSSTYIYIAIRRPHKPASEFATTDLFDVNNPNTAGGNFFESGFPVDMAIRRFVGVSDGPYVASRLSGENYLLTSSTAAEVSDASSVFDNMEGWASGWGTNTTHYSWMFRRAPGFFDAVAYAGDGVNGRALPHNLGVAPEMILAKNRDNANNWVVWHSALNITTESLILNADTATGVPAQATTGWFTQSPTSTNIYPVNYQGINQSAYDYIAYLFASVDGISKVGSYSGTGSDVNIDCGFSAGARFVLLKRSDSTGDWYLYDSERGIVAGDDPYLLLNTNAAQVTSTDYIDPLSSGFTVTSSAPEALNTSGGTYIFLAIA